MAATHIPRTIVNQILQHAQSSSEAEICGLISGRDGKAIRCYAVPNAAATPEHLYRMDPRAQIEALRQMREAGEELYGIYHSHPHSPPRPSAIDLKEASYPQALYLIVSLSTEGVLEMRAFRFRNEAAEEVTLELGE